MKFQSPRFPGLTVNVRHEIPKRHPLTGDIIPRYKNPETGVEEGSLPPIRVCFAVHRGEFEYEDPETGKREIGADISGGYFDTQVAQEQEGWSDAEREMVDRRLLELTRTWPEAVQVVEDAPVVFAAPWPTYDTLTNYLEIAKIAETIGALHETLGYEKQNKNREGVVAELEKRIKDQKADEELVAV